MNPNSISAKQVIKEIHKSKTFCIVGHIRPDGDCIGSQLALTLALKELGKEVWCWNQDLVPLKYQFMDPHHIVQQPTNESHQFDCVIAVDAASYERIGSVSEFIQNRGILINIDHHPSNTRYGDLNWVEPNSASSGELVYQLLKTGKWPITPEVADCLFTAISTDTGSFQFASTKPETFQVAGDLVASGANVGVIGEEVYQSFSLSRVRLLKRVYNQFKLTDNNQIAYLWLRKTDYAKSGASREDTEGLIDHIRAIEPVIVACLFEEVETGVTRISLRSKHTEVNVNSVAKLFGGGGHKAAAGAKIEAKPMTTQRRVIAAIRKELASIKQED